VPEQNFQFITPEFKKISTLGGENMEDKEVELERLKKRLERLGNSTVNLDIKVNLYGQIIILQEVIGEYEQGLNYTKQLLKLAEKENQEIKNKDVHFGFTYCYGKMMTFNRYLGKYEAAISYGKKALNLAVKSKKIDLIVRYQDSLAHLYIQTGKYNEAETIVKQTTELLSNYPLNIHDKISTTISLANIYSQIGHHKYARDLFKETLRLQSEVKNEYGNVNRSIVKSQLANTYRNLGQYEEAQTLSETAFKQVLSELGKNHPITLKVQSDLALIYRDMGDYENATELLHSTLHELEKLEDKIGKSVVYNNLATIYANNNNNEEAVKLFKKAYTIGIKQLGKNHPIILNIKKQLNSVQQKLTPTKSSQ